MNYFVKNLKKGIYKKNTGDSGQTELFDSNKLKFIYGCFLVKEFGQSPLKRIAENNEQVSDHDLYSIYCYELQTNKFYPIYYDTKKKQNTIKIFYQNMRN